MPLTKLTTVLNKISTLATTIRGQATTVKAAFDNDVNVVKTYINDTLTTEIDELDAQNLKLTGTQSIEGVKTFSSSPVVPTPTSNMQASTKKYVDDVGTTKTQALDTHKTSSDHDGRYFTETELSSTTDSSSGADKIGVTSISTLSGNTVQAVLESAKSRFDDIAVTNVNVEVANTHTGSDGSTYTTLPARLNSVDSKMSQKASQIDLNNTNSNVTSNTANIATHTSQIASLASGSPKGVYATISALNTAFPTGNSNTYVVSADGHWYYWNGSGWVSGGVYQSTAINDYSVTNKQLATSAVDTGSIHTYLLNDFNGYRAYFPTASSYETGAPVWLSYDISGTNITGLPILFNTEFYTENTNIIQAKIKTILGSTINDVGGALRNSSIINVLQKKVHNLAYSDSYSSTANYLHVFIWAFASDITKNSEFYFNNYSLTINGVVFTPSRVTTYGVNNALVDSAKNLPTQLLTSKSPLPSQFNGYVITAKTNSINPTKIQIDFVFDISGKGLVNTDNFSFTCDVTSDDTNISGMQSQYFLNNVSTAPTVDGTQLSAETAITYAIPKLTYSRTLAITDSTKTYIHCYLNLIITNNTQQVTFYVNNIKLIAKGITYNFSGSYGIYQPNVTDTISFINYHPKQPATVEYVQSQIPTSYVTNNLYSKIFNILGDSMVHGHTLGFNNTWGSKIGVRNNMSVRDYGINGNCLAGTGIGTGESMVTRYASMENTSDYVGVFGGTNDDVQSIPIGTNTDNTAATFKGSLNILCSGLITKYPTSKIFFITPYHRDNVTIKSYVDAIIERCGEYGIPVFDNYRNGGVIWTNAAQVSALTMGDGYHLNEPGHEFVSDRLEVFMNSL